MKILGSISRLASTGLVLFLMGCGASRPPLEQQTQPMPPIAAPPLETAAPSSSLSMGLNAHWKLDDGVGALAADDSGLGHAATLVNGPAWDLGKLGGGLRFDGVNDFLDSGTDTFGLSGEMSVALWLKPSTIQACQTQVLIQRGQYAYPLMMRIEAKKIRACIRTNPGTTYLTSSTLLASDQWYHAALTFKSGEAILYLNGREEARVSGLGSMSVSAGQKLTIGANPLGQAPFSGILDEVRIYNRALTQEELTLLTSNVVSPFLGQTYYVDYVGGNDNNSGLSAEAAWQHAPGDPRAAINPARVVLQPGDGVLFKGGVVYHGQISIPAQGSDSAPVTYKGDGWPSLQGVRAIIDGSETLTGWQPCLSPEVCGGNPNYREIYQASIPAGVLPNTENLHEKDPVTGEDRFLWTAQYPKPSDPYFMDNRLEFITIPQSRLTRTSITDPTIFNQADPNWWKGSSLMIWVNPNIVLIREIRSFDPLQHRVTFDDLGANALYPDGRDQAYAIYNSIHVLNRPGEYVIDPTPQLDGSRKVYLWPRNMSELANGISYSVRHYGIDLGARSYVTIEGFEVRKHSGRDTRQGVAIGTIRQSNVEKHGITIRNNLLTHNLHSGTGNNRRGYGGVYLEACHDVVVQHNTISYNPRHYGIFLTGACRNARVEGNTIIRPGSTALAFYTAQDSRIIGNTVRESNGSHANGITLYMGCRNILVANNIVLDSGSPLTFEDSGNLFFFNNIIDGHNAEANVNEWGDTSHGPWERGTIAFFHNVMVRNSRNYAFNIGVKPGLNTYIVKNNIIDGGASGSFIDRSHNIYTGLAYNQSARYNWFLGPGEFVHENLATLFLDAAKADYHLITGSPAISAGTDISQYLPTALFPGFDFSRDLNGVVRTRQDIGAFQHNP